MTAISEELVIEERLRRVGELDLGPVVFKLMHAEPGEAALSLDQAEQRAELYRCFLKLCVLYADRVIVPTRDIDHVWHTHILDTAKYRADCDRVFGQCLDHFPYAGLRGEQDRLAWHAAFADTRALFTEHFGIDIGIQPAASACSSHVDGADCCVGCVKSSAATIRPRPRQCPAAP